MQAGQSGKVTTGLSALCLERIITELGKSASDPEVQVYCGGNVVADRASFSQVPSSSSFLSHRTT